MACSGLLIDPRIPGAAEPGGRDRDVRHLSPKHLARRWGMSHRTLERWRWEGRGPAWMKVGGRILYRVEDVERFEQGQMADRVLSDHG